MKLVFTLQEVRDMIRQSDRVKQWGVASGVHFVHVYPDRSGETEVEDIAPIDRVEVEIK